MSLVSPQGIVEESAILSIPVVTVANEALCLFGITCYRQDIAFVISWYLCQ